MSVSRKTAGRAKDGTLNFIFPPEVAEQNYMMLEVIETTRESKTSSAKDQVSRTFILPIPAQLQVQSNMNYEQAGLGMFGAGAAGRVNVTGATDDIVTTLENKYNAISNLLNGGGTAEDQEAASLVQSQLLSTAAIAGATFIGGKIGGRLGAVFGAAAAGTGVADGFLLGEKIAVNPHLAVLFKGVGLRQFGFQYKFVARNKQESDTLKKMINSLQYHMHPDYFVGNLAFKYPDEFKITFSKKRSSSLFDVKRCVLTSMNINYNGEGLPIFFEDVGAPVSIDINMNFQETKIHTKRDYAENYEIERGEAGRVESLEQGVSENGAFGGSFQRDTQGNRINPSTKNTIIRSNQSEGIQIMERQPSAFTI